MYLKQLSFCALIFSTTIFSLSQDRKRGGWGKIAHDAVDYGDDQATGQDSARRKNATTDSPQSEGSDASTDSPQSEGSGSEGIDGPDYGDDQATGQDSAKKDATITESPQSQGSGSEGIDGPEKCQEAMHVFTQEGSNWTVSLKAGSIIIEPDKDEETTGAVTGTIFDGDNYKFHQFELLWDIDEIQDYVTMFANVQFYNDRYVSYAEALDHPDGITQLRVPIEANKEDGNDKFELFLQSMEYIKNPGDSATIKSENSYSFFKNFPEQTTFDYYDSSFYDKLAAQIYPYARIVELPPNVDSNFISRDQFDKAFENLVDTNRKPLKKTIPPSVRPASPPQQVTGLEVSPATG